MHRHDPHQPLRDDVRLLGGLLGETLRRQEGEPLYERVERVRAFAKRTRRSGIDETRAERFAALAADLRAIPVGSAVPIARAFSHFLNLANVAEQHHRVRRRRDYLRDPQARPQPGSVEETLPRLLAAGVAPDALHDAVCALRIGLVITAHPTEIMRRTLQHKYNVVADALAGLDRPDLTPAERAALIDTLRREIAAAWETEEVRRERPSPLDEVRSAVAIFEETLWDAIPQFLRALDRTLTVETGRGLPLDAAPIRFGSWIGGDRDGNPSVTPDVTRRACLMTRWTALTLYAREIEALRFDLSMTAATPELRALAGDAYEPYRAVLRDVQHRLDETRGRVERALAPQEARDPTTAVTGEHEDFETAEQFSAPLRACYESLQRTGNGIIADGRLADVIRRVATFGMTLVRLDIRQEADRHTDAVDDLTRRLGLGAYADLPEDRRVELLIGVLSSGAPIAARGRSRQRGRRRGAGDVPADRGHPSRIARRLRHHDGGTAIRRARRRAPPAVRGRRSSPAGRPALRNRARSARRRRRRAGAVVDPLVSRSRRPQRGPAGSDGRLLGLGQGCRTARGRVGALQGAGSDRGGVTAHGRPRHALSWPRRKRRPRRRLRPTWRSSRSRRGRWTARSASRSKGR